MANKNRKFMVLRIFFAKKVYFDVPHAIGGAWAHFRRTHYSWALSKRSSARSRRAMAVEPMFLCDSISKACTELHSFFTPL